MQSEYCLVNIFRVFELLLIIVGAAQVSLAQVGRGEVGPGALDERETEAPHVRVEVGERVQRRHLPLGSASQRPRRRRDHV